MLIKLNIQGDSDKKVHHIFLENRDRKKTPIIKILGQVGVQLKMT